MPSSVVPDSRLDNRCLATVIDAIPIPIIQCDPQARVVHWNRPAEQSLGRSGPDLAGAFLLDLIPDQVRAQAKHALESLQSGRAMHGLSSGLPDRSLVPLANQAGTLVGLVMIDQQPAPPQCDALERRYQTLLRSNQELDRFAAETAHDLQSPIRTAHLSLDLLANGDGLSEEQQTLIQHANRSLQTALHLVQGILHHARQAAIPEPEDAAESVLLEDIVQESLNNLESRITEVTPSLHLHCSHRVWIARSQLLRLLQNLIGNALKYRSPTRPLELNIGSSADEPGWIDLCINDNGIGMTKEESRRIFQPFTRLATNDNTGGTGIGLHVCRRLVESCGGCIAVTSEVDQGTSFHLKLPAVDSHR
jgi:signal transduction histidine kinase